MQKNNHKIVENSTKEGEEYRKLSSPLCVCQREREFIFHFTTMIDWVSIVRHSRRRFSNYVGTRVPVRIKKRRRTSPTSSMASLPHDDQHQYTRCSCTHVSFPIFLFIFWALCMFYYLLYILHSTQNTVHIIYVAEHSSVWFIYISTSACDNTHSLV